MRALPVRWAPDYGGSPLENRSHWNHLESKTVVEFLARNKAIIALRCPAFETRFWWPEYSELSMCQVWRSHEHCGRQSVAIEQPNKATKTSRLNVENVNKPRTTAKRASCCETEIATCCLLASTRRLVERRWESCSFKSRASIGVNRFSGDAHKMRPKSVLTIRGT